MDERTHRECIQSSMVGVPLVGTRLPLVYTLQPVLAVCRLWYCRPSIECGKWEPDTDTHQLYLIAWSE